MPYSTYEQKSDTVDAIIGLTITLGPIIAFIVYLALNR